MSWTYQILFACSSGCRGFSQPHASTKQTAALLTASSSDAVSVLEIPQNFAPLRLFHRGFGMLSASVILAMAEWCRLCAPSILSWTGSTSRDGTGGTDPLTEFILTMRTVRCGRGRRRSRTSELRSLLCAPWLAPSSTAGELPGRRGKPLWPLVIYLLFFWITSPGPDAVTLAGL